MSIAKLARPEIRALHPYEAAEQVDNTVRLNANESPRSLAVGHFRRPLNRYPEVRPQQLGKTLAERFGCAPEQLLVTRGSSEAIDLIIRTFCAAGRDAVLVNSPSFSMYRHYAEVQGARLIEVPTLAERDFAVDVRDILDACDHDTRLIFICSPNNPTGTTLPREELETLLRERGDRSAIVVDEAYVEFGEKPSATELLADYDNVLVLRTLSKALGFAGARCGAVAGPAEVIRMLSAIQAPYALSTPVIECVEDALLSEQLEAAQEAVAEILPGADLAPRRRAAGCVGSSSSARYRHAPGDALVGALGGRLHAHRGTRGPLRGCASGDGYMRRERSPVASLWRPARGLHSHHGRFTRGQ